MPIKRNVNEFNTKTFLYSVGKIKQRKKSRLHDIPTIVPNQPFFFDSFETYLISFNVCKNVSKQFHAIEN